MSLATSQTQTHTSEPQTATSETQETQRVLLEEKVEIIQQIRSRTQYLSEMVTTLLKIGGFKTLDEVPTNTKHHITALAKRDKTFADLYDRLEDPTALKLPEELKRLEGKLDQFNSHRRDPELRYLIIDQAVCTVDLEMLEADLERHRVYASSPEQLKRYKLATEYVEIVNHLDPGDYHLNKFITPLTFKNQFSNELEINKSFIIHGLG
jgi:hypothetical protein